MKQLNSATSTCKIHLIGAGKTNNAVGVALAQLGFEIDVWDGEIFVPSDRHSMPLYSTEVINQSRVSALCNTIFLLNPQATVNEHLERVEKGTDLEGIVISGVGSSIKHHRKVWKAVKHNPKVHFFIDTFNIDKRTVILSFSPNDKQLCKSYEAWLSGRAKKMRFRNNINYVSWYAGYEIARLVTRFQQNKFTCFMRSIDHNAH